MMGMMGRARRGGAEGSRRNWAWERASKMERGGGEAFGQWRIDGVVGGGALRSRRQRRKCLLERDMKRARGRGRETLIGRTRLT